MADEENLFQLINRREQELLNQISALRGQIEVKENELSYVQKAKAATAISVSINHTIAPFTPTTETTVAPLPPEVVERFAGMTIKKLIVQAMLDNFPHGATAARLRDFIRNAYGRPIEPSSLRPQLHRLKADGVIVNHGNRPPGNDHWSLNPEKRRHYNWYNHPGSEAARTELQHDEEPEANQGTMRNKAGSDDFLE
jgi:hypothetical protein